jgi:4-amino-4-deoxy-L-arabinose transferase-like glycosyltransferase
MLAIGALVWTCAAWLSRGNLDLPGDMAENYAWGIEWQAGYSKHPPLFAWITAAWFSVMPRIDFAYFALSALNAMLGLLGVAALARRFLAPEAAAFAALALAVSPLYTSLAIKFNANSVLLSVWPWTAYFFVAYLQDGRRRDAVACGMLGALAMLGKYFSGVLALALPVAALVVPHWRRRLGGAAPWLALAAGLALLAPHIAWMFEHDFSTLRFASTRSAGGRLDALLRLANYTLAQVGYLLPSLLFLLWALPGSRRGQALRSVGRAFVQPSLRRELWWLSMAPMAVVAAIALLVGTQMASVWGMAQWFALTALWIAVWERDGIEPRVAWLRSALPVLWVVVLLAAAAVGYADARRGSEAASVPRAELAKRAHELWRARTGGALAWVGGPGADAMSVAFYAPGKARWWSPADPKSTPWANAAEIGRDGSLLVCATHDAACRTAAQARVAEPPTRISVRKRAWGIELAPHAYDLYFLLPSRTP